jgi:hypothetical protein
VSRLPAPAPDFSGEEFYVLWGRGWYPLEFFRGELFRWCGREAEWVLYMPDGPPMTLALLLEPGPGIGFEPFHLQVADSAGRTVSTAVVDRLRWVYLSLPWRSGQSRVLTVRARAGGEPKSTPGENRPDLCFRVLQCGWLKGDQAGPRLKDPPPWRERPEPYLTILPPDQGLAFGSGWGPVEVRHGLPCRRAQDAAELILRPSQGETRIHLLLEAVASQGPLELHLRGSDDKPIARLSVHGREVKSLSLPIDAARTSVVRFCLAKGSDSISKGLFYLCGGGWGAAPDSAGGFPVSPAASAVADPQDARGSSSVREKPASAPLAVSTSPSAQGAGTGGPLAPDWGVGEQGIESPVHLHTNACGDFTLLARDDWFDLRGYPEFDLFSMNIDSVFCYSAHYGGVLEEVLKDPVRIYHIEHAAGSGWTPEGQAALFERIAQKGLAWIDYRELLDWARQMHRLQLPMIFNHANWGLADLEFQETSFAGESALKVASRDRLDHQA